MQAEGESWDPVKLALALQKFITDRSKAVLSSWYVFLLLCSVSLSNIFSFDNYISFRYIQLILGSRVSAFFLERVANFGCHLFISWLLNCI